VYLRSDRQSLEQVGFIHASWLTSCRQPNHRFYADAAVAAHHIPTGSRSLEAEPCRLA